MNSIRCDVCGTYYEKPRRPSSRFLCDNCTINALKEKNDEKNDEIEVLRSRLNERNSEIEVLRSRLDERNSEIEVLGSILNARNYEMEVLQPRLNFLHNQFDSESVDGVRKGDVEIVVEGRALSAHKFILSSRSSVFYKMFDMKMIEGNTGKVCIEDTTLPVMQAVIKFCYDAQIKFTNEVTAEQVLEVAHKYDITFLQRTCEAELIQTIRTITNANYVQNVLQLAEKLQATVIEEAARQRLSNFDNVSCDGMVHSPSLSLE